MKVLFNDDQYLKKSLSNYFNNKSRVLVVYRNIVLLWLEEKYCHSETNQIISSKGIAFDLIQNVFLFKPM